MTTSSMTVPRFPPRLEEIFDAWVFAAHDATQALRAWNAARPDDRSAAHAVYRAALDREESAATMLRKAARQRRWG